MLAKVIDFCVLTDFKAPEIPKVNTSELNKVLDDKIREFVEKNCSCTYLAYSVNNLDLFGAAIALRVESLIKAISAYFATQIFFKKNDIQAYKERRDHYKIREITHEDSDKIAAEFRTLNE